LEAAVMDDIDCWNGKVDTPAPRDILDEIKAYPDDLTVVMSRRVVGSVIAEIERLRAELSTANDGLRKMEELHFAVATELAAERERQEFWQENANEFAERIHKLREALAALSKHCEEMEAQNHDYHALGESGQPRLSQPLANSYAILKETGDGDE
jgi:hypothetical protein